MQAEIIRIIDANCNRIGEGLRVLEDMARFVLNDDKLSYELKSIRHDLVTTLSKCGTNILSARNVQEDVGADTESISKNQDIASLITANAKRVEEALRVIEETSKLHELGQLLKPRQFQQARFRIYQLEQTLLSRLSRQDKAMNLKGIYVILDTQMLQSKDTVQVAHQVIKGGASVIQLRDKSSDRPSLLALAKELKEICHKSNVLFIINDHLDLTLAVKADGIHIGQNDLPLSIVRKELPLDKIVGCSIKTPDQAVKAESEGADYVALGSIFPTETKDDTILVGIERLLQVKESISIPLVAIGGINKSNIAEVISAGADCAAVVSAVLNEKDIQKAVKELVKKYE